MMTKKTYFITGGTGSFSKELIKYLLSKNLAKKIIIFSRDEYKQEKMREIPIIKKHISIMRFFIGDVRDLSRLKFALNSDPDILIHAAALKQVPASEYNPFETIKTNVLGAQNVIEAALELNIKKIIALSTDKAAAPSNLYGATKLTSDKLFTSANIFKGKKRCQFSVVRYGNVFGSRGSAIPLFIKQNREKKHFTLTDKAMTRFNITLKESILFVLFCLKKMKGGEIFVPKIPSYKILDVLNAINTKKKIIKIGIRPGEKVDEEMITRSDSINTIEYKKYFIILPSYKKIKYKKLNFFSYNSKDNKDIMSIKKIRQLINDNEYLFEKD